ncbi:hypothetical protein CONPUDRAFT_29597, partial [Coniophora puteana RWD-64-598 SS2]
RCQDVNLWKCWKVLQVALALFHLVLNLIWTVHLKYQGSVVATGSLSWFYGLLDKARLGNPHPDYHTLLMALLQTLDALLLDAWHKILNKHGFSSFTAFAKLNLSPKTIHAFVAELHSTFAS